MDRDGVINVKPPVGQYVERWDQFRLIPAAVDWIKLFRGLHFLVIVVTNQRCIARELVSTDAVRDIHDKMMEQLASMGAPVDDVFCCPHEEGECACRKPLPGLILEAQRKWSLERRGAIVIGDSETAEELAANFKMRFIRVQEGKILSIHGHDTNGELQTGGRPDLRFHLPAPIL
jgi:D-glycero-D-manno-heptose 1,7-bisphosphate phosphatase